MLYAIRERQDAAARTTVNETCFIEAAMVRDFCIDQIIDVELFRLPVPDLYIRYGIELTPLVLKPLVFLQVNYLP